MDSAYYAAVDKWVALLAEQEAKREAGQVALTPAELDLRWSSIFSLPEHLNTGLGSAAVWGWRCFRFKHPYLSVAEPVGAGLVLLNLIFGSLYSSS